jgi:hypothetical protein
MRKLRLVRSGGQPPVEGKSEEWTDRMRAARARARALDELGPLSGLVAFLGEPETAEEVTIDLERELISLSSARGLIGSWRLDEIDLAVEEEGFRIDVEGEQLVLVTSDDRAFAMGVGLVPPGETPRRVAPRTAGDLFR